ncbi:MAG: signal peptidase I [Proteobacteria bacterium]|nr:signal peptidase I [Pseudomonadota bacterium]
MTNKKQTLKQKYKSIFYPPKEKKLHFFIMDNFRAIVFALAVAMFIRTFFFEPFKIPSTSMVPTLRIGDFLFISKFDYGTKVPFTNTVYNKKSIQVGDVIVFDKDIQNTGKTTTYIKRVVATANDTIEFSNSKIILNNKIQEQEYKSELAYEDQHNQDIIEPEHIEVLGTIKHSVLESSNLKVPNVSKIKVPEGYVIVMGDNRDHSFDSRLWKYPNWGLVKESEVRGKARFLFFSWNRKYMPRFDRIFKSLVPEKAE